MSATSEAAMKAADEIDRILTSYVYSEDRMTLRNRARLVVQRLGLPAAAAVPAPSPVTGGDRGSDLRAEVERLYRDLAAADPEVGTLKYDVLLRLRAALAAAAVPDRAAPTEGPPSLIDTMRGAADKAEREGDETMAAALHRKADEWEADDLAAAPTEGVAASMPRSMLPAEWSAPAAPTEEAGEDRAWVVVSERNRLIVRLTEERNEARAERDALRDTVRARDAEIEKLRVALRYISSPTMGLPSGVDAYDYAMDGATEHNARYALQICIRMARAALPPSPGELE